ncbi:MAG: hypothetical protein J0I12_28765 [Candidatus Eremiobacteraeota bacterium]|nr:hypothetical protein [Candidatus Eremiobacteraeota bacterium]
MNISLKFAVDRNRDQKIQPEEMVGVSQLRERDGDGDRSLKGAELKDVYFQYGEDTWLEAGRRHRMSWEKGTQVVELRSIGLEPPKVDLHIDMTF